MKFLSTIVAFLFIFSTLPVSAEIGIKIPFGQGSDPKKIEKLKNEETSGAWTGIGLIVLAAAIVAATIIIVNEVDKVVDEVDEEVDETQELLEDAQDLINP